MKKHVHLILFLIALATLAMGCKTMNNTQKGAVIGAAGGAAAGAVIGRTAGNTGAGAVVGATVGGVAGAVIGRQMDKQAEEIENEVPGVIVERVGDGGITVEFSSQILFGFDSYQLTAEARTNLDKLVEILNRYPDTDIEIQGHTDNVGSAAYNQSLSERRAGSVANYLKAREVTAERLSVVGFGLHEPKYSNNTAEGRAQNRRVEFLITANEKMIADAEREAQGQ